jgi:hypothetical protein
MNRSAVELGTTSICEDTDASSALPLACKEGLTSFEMGLNLHIMDGWVQYCRLVRNEDGNWAVASLVRLEVAS